VNRACQLVNSFDGGFLGGPEKYAKPSDVLVIRNSMAIKKSPKKKRGKRQGHSAAEPKKSSRIKETRGGEQNDRVIQKEVGKTQKLFEHEGTIGANKEN